MVSVEGLLAELHGALLRKCSNRLGVHCQGLAQASRRLKQMGLIEPRMANKLIQIDFSFNLIRHITQASVDGYIGALASKLQDDARVPERAAGQAADVVEIAENAKMISTFSMKGTRLPRW